MNPVENLSRSRGAGLIRWAEMLETAETRARKARQSPPVNLDAVVLIGRMVWIALVLPNAAFAD